MSEYVRYSRYALFNEDKKRRETWGETVDRVFDMHERKYAKQIGETPKLAEIIAEAKDGLFGKRILGSQRALQFGGAPIERGNAKMFNCAFGNVCRDDVFGELLHLLLCGCGAGASIQKHHVKQIGDISPVSGDTVVFKPEDSIEGWADCINVLMASYLGAVSIDGFGGWGGKVVEFDYSDIRPAGALISGGFKAPGSNGLNRSVELIREVIEARLKDEDFTEGEFSNKLKPINILDIICHLSDAVLSGGVRRCLFHESEVKLGNGSFKQISELTLDDTVLYAGKEYPVTEVMDNGVQSLVKITSKYGYQVSTPNHKWLVYDHLVENMGWMSTSIIEAETSRFSLVTDRSGASVEVGDNLLPSDYKLSRIGKTERIEDGRTYDISVADVHAFTVRQKDSKFESVSHNSALIIIFSIDDEEVMNAKTGNWFNDNPQRARSNNSAVFIRGDSTKEEFDMVKERVREYGEPAFVFMDDNESGVNPCCVSGRNKIQTDMGDKLVSDLVGVQFKTEIYGALYESTECGFWSTGTKKVYELVLDDFNDTRLKVKQLAGGLTEETVVQTFDKLIHDPTDDKHQFDYDPMIGTADHRIQRFDDSWVNIGDINDSTIVQLSNGRMAGVKEVRYVGEEEVYDCTVPESSSFSCNGVIVHNCEISFRPVLPDGRQGFQMCNLSTINGKYTDTAEKFYKCCREAAIIGTLQAGYTDFKYIASATKELTDKEALLGVSITGIMDNPAITLDPEIQRKGAEIVKETNALVADLIGVSRSARTTCVKPEGSSSCLLGTSSGVHPHHSRKYVRRIQCNSLEFPAQYFGMFNPSAIEKSVWSANDTDNVISFVCEVPKGAIVKNQLGAIELLENVKLTQQNWVEHGTRPELSNKPYLRHNVSNTISVKEDEWDEVFDYLWTNQDNFTGVSMLPSSGDKDYPQSPFSTVYTPAEMVKEYGDATVFASGLITAGLRAFDHNLWSACSHALGIEQLNGEVDVAQEKYDTLLEELSQANIQYKTIKDIISDKMTMNNVDEVIEYTASYSPELNELSTKIAKLEQKLDDADDALSDTSSQYDLKQDWIRRALQFADRYFEGDVKRMTYCLKDVTNWKIFCDLKREYVDVDWSKAYEESAVHVDADTMAGASCSGGACEIT